MTKINIILLFIAMTFTAFSYDLPNGTRDLTTIETTQLTDKILRTSPIPGRVSQMGHGLLDELLPKLGTTSEILEAKVFYSSLVDVSTYFLKISGNPDCSHDIFEFEIEFSGKGLKVLSIEAYEDVRIECLTDPGVTGRSN